MGLCNSSQKNSDFFLPITAISHYNIVRVLALCKSYRAAMKKIFIYARPCVNKMT